jgi:signal transduction histidine kinase
MATFRSKARLVEILGEHLIKDNTVGLLELVKNAYDADATEVEIHLEKLKKQEQTCITVQDNGEGMTLATVGGAWLEPANGAKEILKEKAIRSKRGRLPLGEKGVGRFAAHKLGKHLTLVTRHVNSDKEVVLEIDWRPFESHDAYLEDIILNPKECVPQVFTGSKHGTCLIMRQAREQWRDEDLRRLQASLQKLKSPTRGAADFEVKLHCPEYPQFENLDAVDLLDTAHFSLAAIIDEEGMVEFDYECNFGGGHSEARRQHRNIWHEMNPKLQRKPSCGPFYLDLRVWIRKAEFLRQANVTKEQLNAFAGISLFRDGIRVLPYGDEGDDWLLLDKRRIDDPTRRFANNQVIGFVEINQTTNRTLVDKANREGLQENEAFHDLRDLVQSCVKLLEQLSAGERNKLTGEKKQETPKNELVATIEEAEAAARKSEAEARTVSQAIEKMESKGWMKPEAAKSLAQQMEKLAGEVSNYRERVENANQTVKEIFSDEDKEREAFLHLVAVGVVAERFTHEFGRLVTLCSETLRQLRVVSKGNNAVSEAVVELERHIGALQNELVPLGNLVHRNSLVGKTASNPAELVQIVLTNNKPRLTDAHIQVVIRGPKNGRFVVPIRESVLAQVFDNILDNAIYWLARKSAKDDRRLEVHIDNDNHTLLFTNNGPSLAGNMRGRLFQKFQTAKLDGRGLGLFICRELLVRYGGSIRAVESEEDSRCLDGASFLVDLSQATTGKK